METTKPSEQRVAVGDGKTQLLCETYIKIKPPMSEIIKETYSAEITDYTVFNDQVLVKGIIDHTFYYQHPHGIKAQDDENGDNGKVRGSNSGEYQEEKVDEFKCLDGWGNLVNFYGGIVHFHRQFFEFTGNVEIVGVIPGDVCTGTAQITHFDLFEATELEDTGLISGGLQTFKIDVALTATR